MSVRKSLTVAALGLTMAACAGSGAMDPGEGPSPVNKYVQRTATVEVENFNWQDITVYAVHLNSRVRLGTVTSMSKARFRLPTRFVSGGADFRLLADPIGGGRAYLSDNIRVRDGQAVAFSVQNMLTLSTVAIWDR
jgi:hypothetical protein